MREVSSRDQDKTVPDFKVLESLLSVLHALHNNSANSPNPQCAGVMYNALGYEIKRLDSTIPGAGKGVFVTKGTVPVKSLVALYPGMIKTEVLITNSRVLFCAGSRNLLMHQSSIFFFSHFICRLEHCIVFYQKIFMTNPPASTSS